MNVPPLEHLSFERSHDGSEVIVHYTLDGKQSSARLTLGTAALALGDLCGALGIKIKPETAPE